MGAGDAFGVVLGARGRSGRGFGSVAASVRGHARQAAEWPGDSRGQGSRYGGAIGQAIDSPDC